MCAVVSSEINRLEELEAKLLKETIEAAQIEKTIIEVSLEASLTIVPALAPRRNS